ncbi:DUF4113 domain-containing protein [Candidatus Kaiserbacteria bacterium]|nr:DUF4113 domain-containing protein [Candidatus Kaiserbacteria bacterium]
MEANLLLPTADTAVILSEAMHLLERLYEPGVPYKKAGVILSHLVPSAEQPASLFTLPTVPSNTILTKAIDAINARFGREKIQLGRHSSSENWQSKHDNLSPSYTTRWNDLAVVR